MARYANIPIGNLPEDQSVFVCDILLARSLYFNKAVLWWSQSSMPDLGGEDNSCELAFEHNFITQPIINPGLYTTITVELDLGILAANAILCYKHLYTGSVFENNIYDERVLCLHIFRKL